MSLTTKIKNIIEWPDKALASTAIVAIGLYQKTISPDHSAKGKLEPFHGCKFYPSCSEYAILSLEKKGFLLALPKIFWRLLRCHPWSKGGIDKP